MDYSHFAIILLVIGLVLLVGEIFIPSGGMILITSGVCLVASIWFAWKAWAGPESILAGARRVMSMAPNSSSSVRSATSARMGEKTPSPALFPIPETGSKTWL